LELLDKLLAYPQSFILSDHFFLFNEFDAPKQSKIKVNTAEIYKIQINEKKILLIAKDPLYQRYRHIFHPIYRVVRFIPLEEEKKEAIIFIMDNPADIGCNEKDLIEVFPER
jgi:hypothetical protein